MNHERYDVGVDVTLGTEVLAETFKRFRSEVQGQGVVVTGSVVSRAGPVQIALAEIRAIDPDALVLRLPPMTTYGELRDFVRKEGPERMDWLVAVGGGRVMDLSKLIAIATNGSPAIAALSSSNAFDTMLPAACAVPNLFVPTTIGSGAEVSMLADVLRNSSGAKVPFAGEVLRPAKVLVDSCIARAPLAVAGPALIDALTHVIDPWLNWAPEPSLQVRSSVHVLSSLVEKAASIIAGLTTARDLLDLARLSHLAVLPGLARPAAHVSSIHRIEHCLPSELFGSHGAGLAWVGVRYLEWAERERANDIAPFADAVVRAFGRRALPSRLLAEIFNKLAPGSTDVELTHRQQEEVLDRVATFLVQGLLPGNLRVTESDVRTILSDPTIPARPEASLPMTTRHPASSLRVFGGADPTKGLPLVVTPISSVFLALAPTFDSSDTSWYRTAEVEIDGTSVLAVRVTPGASALTDLMDLLHGAGLSCPRAYFLGLAGSLDLSIPLGRCVEPSALLEWSPNMNAKQTPNENEVKKWTSVASLGEECDDLFQYLRWAGVDLIDLEAAAFSGHCRSHERLHTTILAVSDYPAVEYPIWSGEERTSKVVGECVAELLSVLGTELQRAKAKTDDNG